MSNISELERACAHRDQMELEYKSILRDLIVAYIHVLTQSGYILEFYPNGGGIKSIAPPPRGENE